MYFLASITIRSISYEYPKGHLLVKAIEKMYFLSGIIFVPFGNFERIHAYRRSQPRASGFGLPNWEANLGFIFVRMGFKCQNWNHNNMSSYKLLHYLNLIHEYYYIKLRELTVSCTIMMPQSGTLFEVCHYFCKQSTQQIFIQRMRDLSHIYRLESKQPPSNHSEQQQPGT